MLLGAVASAQDSQPDVERRQEELHKELKALQGDLGDRLKGIEEKIEELRSDYEEEIAGLRKQAESGGWGSTKFLIDGDAFAGFTLREGGHSTFFPAFNPHFYWKVNDQILFGTGVELEVHDYNTDVNLEWAMIHVALADSVTVGIGKFLMPFGYFQENIHSAYINKLPDEPLAFFERSPSTLAPLHDIGVQVRGPIPWGSTRFNYVVYVANGPELLTGEDDIKEAGTLTFENFDDSNTNKALGGRLGFQPIPRIEVGYSFMQARVGAEGTPFEHVDAILQDVDANYVGTVESLKGNLDLRAEWVWTAVDRATYGAPGSTVSFANRRSGGYLQAAYRPTKVESPVLSRLEVVGRFDRLDQPDGGPLRDETRWTGGLNYWFGPSSVFKVAVQHAVDEGDALLMQFAIGF